MDFLIQLVPLALVILIGFGIWHWVRRGRLASPVTAPPERIGGWLLLVAIGQQIGILRVLAEIAKAWPDCEKYWSNPVMKPAIIGEVMIALGLAIFMFYAAIMMTNKRRIFGVTP